MSTTPADIVLVSGDGTVIEGRHGAHGFQGQLAIHRARPKLRAGLHVHSLHTFAWSSRGGRLAPLTTDPDFHNPSRVTLSSAKRAALVELAERYGFYIIVDNPYREMRFAGEAQGFQVFNDSDLAIHVNTFTKTACSYGRDSLMTASTLRRFSAGPRRRACGSRC